MTGIVTDVDQVAITLHRYGAQSCWDYAAAGPYLPIDMNAVPDIPNGPLAYKDAVFVSPHKFVGGPGTPGVLVAKRWLVRNRVPSVPGGGTILFVSPTGHSYHPDPAIREEGGTPAIVESVRAGLVFALKDAVGTDEIRRREHDLARRALRSWSANPRIEILGNPDLERLAIVSLGLRHPSGHLHANFVVAVLSDLFGIQARSGCFCAGPYIHRMYPIDDAWSRRMDAEVAKGHLGAKLAFTRLTFNYFITRDRLPLHRRRRAPDRRRGLEAAGAVPLRSRLGPVAAPRPRARSAAEPARLRCGAGRRAAAPAPPRPRACSRGSCRPRGRSSRRCRRARRRVRCTTRCPARSSSASAGSRFQGRGWRSC